MDKRLFTVKGDITLVDAEAIVNAANRSLLGGGGVDGAIHRAAGPGLLEECRLLNGCETGQAKLTNGHNLKAKYVIHTVGPVWRGGASDEHELLSMCYRNCLEIAAGKKVKTLAFPGISTGVYGFPKEEAANIAVTETFRFVKKNKYPAEIIFVAFDDETHNLYRKLLAEK